MPVMVMSSTRPVSTASSTTSGWATVMNCASRESIRLVADPSQNLAQHHHEQEAARHALGQHAQVGRQQAHHGDYQENRPWKGEKVYGFFSFALIVFSLQSLFFRDEGIGIRD